jgi:Protein of unknown function (DUF3072)
MRASRVGRQRADARALERLNFVPLRDRTYDADQVAPEGCTLRLRSLGDRKLQIGFDLKLEPAMSYDKFPDRLSRPMSRGQAATLRTLSIEAYQPKLFDEKLTREEADRRIEALRQEIALANSF